MLLDLTEVMKALDGSIYKDAQGKDMTMGRVLAGELVKPTNENIRQFYLWSNKLWETGKIDVDEAQISLLESIIETAKDWNVTVKGRLLSKIEAAKSKMKKV